MSGIENIYTPEVKIKLFVLIFGFVFMSLVDFTLMSTGIYVLVANSKYLSTPCFELFPFAITNVIVGGITGILNFLVSIFSCFGFSKRTHFITKILIVHAFFSIGLVIYGHILLAFRISACPQSYEYNYPLYLFSLLATIYSGVYTIFIILLVLITGCVNCLLIAFRSTKVVLNYKLESNNDDPRNYNIVKLV